MFSLEENQDYFSFVIVRPFGKGNLSFRIRSWVLKSVIIGSFLSVFLLAFSIYFFTNANASLAEYKKLKDLTVQQEETLSQLNDQVDTLQGNIDELLDKEEQINYILETERKKRRRSKKKRRRKSSLRRKFDKSYAALSGPVTSDLVNEKLVLLTDQFSDLSTRLEKEHARLLREKDRFASTPSIWPIHGYVKSGYGKRRHPVTGRYRFHKGVDIPAWVGAPIQSTADGIVLYSGWSGGYGYMVIIDHGYGYRTVYAHASQLLVRKGEAVKKGQTIAQAGTTGLSTGPHVHYEVQRWRRALPPKQFLDLDMFTASTRVW